MSASNLGARKKKRITNERQSRKREENNNNIENNFNFGSSAIFHLLKSNVSMVDDIRATKDYFFPFVSIRYFSRLSIERPNREVTKFTSRVLFMQSSNAQHEKKRVNTRPYLFDQSCGTTNNNRLPNVDDFGH